MATGINTGHSESTAAQDLGCPQSPAETGKHTGSGVHPWRCWVSGGQGHKKLLETCFFKRSPSLGTTGLERSENKILWTHFLPTPSSSDIFGSCCSPWKIWYTCFSCLGEKKRAYLHTKTMTFALFSACNLMQLPERSLTAQGAGPLQRHPTKILPLLLLFISDASFWFVISKKLLKQYLTMEQPYGQCCHK